MEWCDTRTKWLLLTVFIFICEAAGKYQDHVVEWSRDNTMFLNWATRISVNIGDNLIFVCNPRMKEAEQLFWTYDPRVFHTCLIKSNSEAKQLLDCGRQADDAEFILKVASFSEISYNPTFKPGRPTYFVAQSNLCRVNNIRLKVEIATDSEVSSTIVPGKSPQLKLSHGDGNLTQGLFRTIPNTDPIYPPRLTNQHMIFIPLFVCLTTLFCLSGIILTFCRCNPAASISCGKTSKSVSKDTSIHVQEPFSRLNGTSTNEAGHTANGYHSPNTIGIGTVPRSLYSKAFIYSYPQTDQTSSYDIHPKSTTTKYEQAQTTKSYDESSGMKSNCHPSPLYHHHRDEWQKHSDLGASIIDITV